MTMYATGNTTQSSTGTNNASSLIFNGAGNVSVGISGGSIVISGGTAAPSPVNFSAGTTSNNLGAVVFSNSNGVSFGLNGSTITASVGGGAGDGYNILAAGTQTANTTGTVIFNNSNGISFGMSNSSQITASYTVPSTAGLISAINISAGTTSNNSAAIMFANSNGISFGLNAGTVTGTVKTDYQSSNANYLTSQSNQAVSGANGSFTFQTITFANSNGVSWSTGTQGLYATVKTDYLTTARESNDAVGLNTAQTNVTWTVNSSGISINASGYAGTGTTFAGANLSASMTMNSAGLNLSMSAAAPGGGGAVNFSAGTTSNNLQSIIFANENGVSFGLGTGASSQSLTASVNAGGGGAVSQRWFQAEMVRFSLSNLTNITGIDRIPFYNPVYFDGTVTVARVQFEMSRSTTGSNAFSVSMGLFSYNNSTQIGLISSFAGNYSNTATVSVSGIRRFDVTLANTFSLAPGNYVMGMMFSQLASASMNYSLRGFSGAAQVGGLLNGTDAYVTATSSHIIPFFGRRSASSAGFLATVAQSEVIGQFSGVSTPLNPWFIINSN
jgi:hypothetical protein